MHSGNRGLYLGPDQLIYKPPGREPNHPWPSIGGTRFCPAEWACAFAQYSWAPKDRNEANHYVGGRLQCRGLLRGREEDLVGVGVAQVIFSDHLPDQSTETAVELFYKARLTPRTVIQPDLQYIARPDGEHRDAFAL